jgi:hypothetical protein
MSLSRMTLRKMVWSNRDVGELARDVQDVLDTIPRVIHRTFEGLYTEPMLLGNLSEKPDAIELIHIESLVATETPVLCGSLVHFVWKPQSGGVRITSIDGLTPSTTIKYRFVFRLSFASAQGGA